MTSSVTYIIKAESCYLAIFVSLTYTYLKDFVQWMDLSITYIRQGGILLLSYFCFTDLHLFKGFCLVNGFVSNVHPSSVTYIRHSGILLLISLTYPFKGLCHLDMFVSNLHAPRQNLVTWPFDFISGWICLYKDIKRETCLLISRKNKFI